MNFFAYTNVKHGEIIPDTWIGTGKLAYHTSLARYLKICFPLFQLGWADQPESRQSRFGWFVPSICIIFEKNILTIVTTLRFHSYFMGEQRIVSYRETGRITFK